MGLRIIHTADWHLGQVFFGYDRKAEHSRFFQWLKKVINERQADVLLIAGDVFDGPNPSAESQKLYYSFLHEITIENTDLQVIIIAGNHDSAARLEAPNPLLENMNVTVRGIVRHDNAGQIDYGNLIVPLKKGGCCLAVPYLRQGDFEQGDYSTGIKAVYDCLHKKAAGNHPIIAMGHLQATGAEISENDRSERTIIGGLECVSPDAFNAGITYVALGHLHRPQQVSHRSHIRYAGAPIPMSFAEKRNKQGVFYIEIDKDVRIEKIEYSDTVRLITLPNEAKPLNEVLDEIAELPDGEVSDSSPFLEIKVLMKGPEPSMRHQIEEALRGKAVRLTRIEAVINSKKETQEPHVIKDLQAITPMEVAMRVFEKAYGNEEMPETMKQLLNGVIQEVGQ